MANHGAIPLFLGQHDEKPVDLEACMDAKGRFDCARLLLNKPASR
ncbi:MAG: hypothetical protein ACYC99_11520 [Candidatus Geothermincolia bacterium]